MAIENVTKFMKTLSEDQKLQEKLLQGNPPQSPLSEEQKQLLRKRIISVAKESGFSFTAEELNQYEASIQKPDSASKDWDVCFCMIGGGGHNRTKDYSCACVLAGGGKADNDGMYLGCFLAGQMQHYRK